MPFQWPFRSCSPGSAARDPGLLRPPGPVSSLLARLEEIWARADSDAASSCLPSSYNILWSNEGMHYIIKLAHAACSGSQGPGTEGHTCGPAQLLAIMMSMHYTAHLSLDCSLMDTPQECGLGSLVVAGGRAGCPAEQASRWQDLLHLSRRYVHLQQLTHFNHLPAHVQGCEPLEVPKTNPVFWETTCKASSALSLRLADGR